MNLPTMIVAAIVAVVFISIIAKAIIDKKNGKSSCAGNCGSCKGCH